MKTAYQNAETIMSDVSMVILNCYRVVFDHLQLSINVSNVVLMYRIDVKYQYTIRAV